MIFYVASHEFGMYFEPSEEVPNLDAERFHSLLEAVNRPFIGRVCAFAVSFGGMLSNKSKVNQSQSPFDQWDSLISEISP